MLVDTEKWIPVTKLQRELTQKLKEVSETGEPGAKEIYNRRKTRAELPFGHMKRNLKTDGFLMRGRSGVNAETSLLGTCFNLARMITILGVSGLIDKLIGLQAPIVG